MASLLFIFSINSGLACDPGDNVSDLPQIIQDLCNAETSSCLSEIEDISCSIDCDSFGHNCYSNTSFASFAPGLQQLTNLSDLSFFKINKSKNTFDLTGLNTYLPQLESLTLNHIPISNGQEISNHPSIDELNILQNENETTKSLVSFPVNLFTLVIESTKPSKIPLSAFQSINDLFDLSLNKIKITNLDSLKTNNPFTKLRTFSGSSTTNRLNKQIILSGQGDMYSLHLSKIKNVESTLQSITYPLDQLHLNSLSLNNNSLSKISELTDLDTLEIDSCKKDNKELSDFSFITPLANIYSLSFTNVDVENLSFLSNISLGYLSVESRAESKPINLSALDSLTNIHNSLFRLELASTSSVESISSISHLTNLETFSIHINNEKELSELVGALESLNSLNSISVSISENLNSSEVEDAIQNACPGVFVFVFPY